MTKNLVAKKKFRAFGMFWFLGLYIFLYIIVLVKFISLLELNQDALFVYYSIIVASYFLLRYGLSYLYQPADHKFNKRYLPTVTFAIPAKNEEDNIYDSIISIGNSNYPKKKFEIIAVNDGSTDNTYREMRRAQKFLLERGIKTWIVDKKKNEGKREAMADSIRRSNSEIMIFVDSDSFVEPNTARELVKYFAVDSRIGAVTAHTFARNSNQNLLTKLQTIHYYASFKIFKSTESLFGSVTCCPGCCSAYRTKYIRGYINKWCEQKFLGVTCTYGDDRSLTNFLLKSGYLTVFSPTAIATTVVPSKLKIFLKQQLRWKKSWTRETLLASTFFWKRNKLMALIFYTGMILTFFTTYIFVRSLIWYPIVLGVLPNAYLFGLFLIAGVFSLYYKQKTGDRKWFYGLLYPFFYSLVLNWQMFYALATLRDQKWGTR